MDTINFKVFFLQTMVTPLLEKLMGWEDTEFSIVFMALAVEVTTIISHFMIIS